MNMIFQNNFVMVFMWLLTRLKKLVQRISCPPCIMCCLKCCVSCFKKNEYLVVERNIYMVATKIACLTTWKTIRLNHIKLY